MKFTWQTDASLALTALSPHMCSILKPGPVPPTLEDIAGPDSPIDFGMVAHEWALQGERVTFEVTLGGVRYASFVEPLYAPDGTIAGVSGSAEPAQDRTAAERRTLLAAHAEAIASAGSWFYDARTGEYEWSDGLYELLGVDCWMPVTHDLRGYDAPEDEKAIKLAIAHARLRHERYSIDHRVRRLDGETRFVQENGAFYFDENGLLSHVIGTLVDVTDRNATLGGLRLLVCA